MTMAGFPHIAGPEDFAAAIPVSRETLGALKTYVALLGEWGRVQDLVAPSTLGDIWHRHIADSAQLLPLAPPTAKQWVDLGSGAGFPGLVLAITARERPGFRMRLVESSNRKCSFLREVARQTGAPVDILCMRIEELATHHTLTGVEVVTARALAPLGKLLDLARPLLADTTVALFLKGRDASREVEEAQRRWRFQVKATPSRTDPDGRIVEIRQLRTLEGAEP
jgi:16S rRNA (guanine527-N7)-methyltransferase